MSIEQRCGHKRIPLSGTDRTICHHCNAMKWKAQRFGYEFKHETFNGREYPGRG